MEELWLGCQNCHLAFYNDREYKHHFRLVHPKKKLKVGGLIESMGGSN
jgi:hypothetical protein